MLSQTLTGAPQSRVQATKRCRIAQPNVEAPDIEKIADRTARYDASNIVTQHREEGVNASGKQCGRLPRRGTRPRPFGNQFSFDPDRTSSRIPTMPHVHQ